MRILNVYIIIILCLAITSCSKKKKMSYNPPSNLTALLAGDSLKVWKIAKRYNGKTRMNMGACFLGYKQTFTTDNLVYDNNGFLADCGPSFKGSWEIIKDSLQYSYIRITSDQIPELMGIQEGYKDFRIFYVSKDSLHISFIHKQYGKKRRISDYLVREELNVPDRNFHFK